MHSKNKKNSAVISSCKFCGGCFTSIGRYLLTPRLRNNYTAHEFPRLQGLFTQPLTVELC